MAYAKIDYGFSTAKMWGDFQKSDAERFFMHHANECFGLRKSVMDFNLLEFDTNATIPSPWDKMEGAAVVLQHNFPMNDTIVWNNEDKKIKSEWD